MAASDDWYREPCLTEEAKAEFERRLARSRSSRSEYLRIQAHVLADVGAFDAAITMLNRAPSDDRSVVSSAASIYEQRGDDRRAAGRFDDAIADYRRSIEKMTGGLGFDGRGHFGFASVVLELQRSDLYRDALDYLDKFWTRDPLFPVDKFEQFGLKALLLHAMGNIAEARPLAECAVAAAGKQQSGAARQAKLGLVDEKFWPMLADLEKILLVGVDTDTRH